MAVAHGLQGLTTSFFPPLVQVYIDSSLTYFAYSASHDSGYDICWVTLPGYGFSNAAESAEYVAYNIKALAAKSATKKVFVVGWSQGAGLDIQWVSIFDAVSRTAMNDEVVQALDFFPSTQQVVSGFFSITGDFHGSAGANAVCTAIVSQTLSFSSNFR